MKRYRKFNLEQALNGAKLETREGLKVKSIHLIENTNSRNPLVVVLEDGNGPGEDSIINCTINGRYWNDNCDSSLDLFIIIEPKVYYANVYKDFFTGGVTVGGKLYDTFEEAYKNAVEGGFMKYLKTISFTDELEDPCKDIEIDQTAQYWKDQIGMIEFMLNKAKQK